MTVVDLYTIQIVSDDNAYNYPHAEARPRLDALMAETEENLNDLLNRGYRARIRRWDDPNPDEGADDE